MHSSLRKSVAPLLALSSFALSAPAATPQSTTPKSEPLTSHDFRYSESEFNRLPFARKLVAAKMYSRGKVELPLKLYEKTAWRSIIGLLGTLAEQYNDFRDAKDAGASGAELSKKTELQVAFILEKIHERGIALEKILGQDFRKLPAKAQQLLVLDVGIKALLSSEGILYPNTSVIGGGAESFVLNTASLSENLFVITQLENPTVSISAQGKGIPLVSVQQFSGEALESSTDGGLAGVLSFAFDGIAVLNTTAIRKYAGWIWEAKSPYIQNFGLLKGLSEEDAIRKACNSPSLFTNSTETLERRIKSGGFAIDRILFGIIDKELANPIENLMQAIIQNVGPHEVAHMIDLKKRGSQQLIEYIASQGFSIQDATEAEALKEISVRLAAMKEGPGIGLFDLISSHRGGFQTNRKDYLSIANKQADKEIFNGLIEELSKNPRDFGLMISDDPKTYGEIKLSKLEQILSLLATLDDRALAARLVDRIDSNLRIDERKAKLAQLVQH